MKGKKGELQTQRFSVLDFVQKEDDVNEFYLV